MLCDMRMVKLAEYFNFPLNFFEYSLHFDLLFIQNLNRNLMASNFILSNYINLKSDKITHV